MAAVPTSFSPSRTVSAVRSPSANTRETARSIACAASSRLSDQRSNSAALKMAPTGFATPFPAMSGADPWIGSYNPAVPAPRLADGSMPSAPASMDASSVRMSPKRFSVSTTSYDGGLTAGRRIAPLGPAEVETTGQLANHQEIDVAHSLRAQRRGGDHRRIDANRAQIGEEAKSLAKSEQRRAGAKLAVRGGIIPFRSAHGAEEDRVRGFAEAQRLRAQRQAVRIDGRAAHDIVDIVERDASANRRSIQHPSGRSGHLWPDAVSGEDDDARGCWHVRRLSCDRQREADLRPFSRIADGFDRATVGGHDVLGDRQSEPRSRRTGALDEAIEDARAQLGRYPLAGVADAEGDCIVRSTCTGRDGSARRRVADRV